MGRSGVEDMLEWVSEDTALEWHLQSNHYPPIHPSFVPVAKQAIDRAMVALDEPIAWEEKVVLPSGRTMTVRAMVDGLHLWPFVEARLEE